LEPVGKKIQRTPETKFLKIVLRSVSGGAFRKSLQTQMKTDVGSDNMVEKHSTNGKGSRRNVPLGKGRNTYPCLRLEKSPNKIHEKKLGKGKYGSSELNITTREAGTTGQQGLLPGNSRTPQIGEKSSNKIERQGWRVDGAEGGGRENDMPGKTQSGTTRPSRRENKRKRRRSPKKSPTKGIDHGGMGEELLFLL